MGTLEEVKNMREQGRQEQDIIGELQQRGLNPQEISETLAQTKIKDAVSGESEESSNYESSQMTQEQPANYPPQYQNTQQYEQAPSQSNNYAPQYRAQQEEYPSYENYAPALSTDTINEIAEQVTIEKLAPLHQKMEEAISFKANFETRVEQIDDRLQRIEKIIDRLQLSILQKVGEYVSNVGDMKRELEETQKSFKSLVTQHQKSKDNKNKEE